jgi:hypothetical protein
MITVLMVRTILMVAIKIQLTEVMEPMAADTERRHLHPLLRNAPVSLAQQQKVRTAQLTKPGSVHPAILAAVCLPMPVE